MPTTGRATRGNGPDARLRASCWWSTPAKCCTAVNRCFALERQPEAMRCALDLVSGNLTGWYRGLGAGLRPAPKPLYQQSDIEQEQNDGHRYHRTGPDGRGDG